MYKLLPILLFAYSLAVTTNENYNNSWALVICISKYKDLSDLNYPASDAQIISDLINKKFHFPKSNILTLLNEEATKENILSSLLLINSSADTSDRIIIFYAGQTFSTQNIKDAWNGNANGKTCPVDTYIYIIEYEVNESSILRRNTKTGTLYLIR